MSDEFLSQDELDALLKGMSSESSEDTFRGGGSLSDLEKDMIGEIGNISMGAAATALSTILGREVDITIPKVEELPFGEVGKGLSGEQVVVVIEYIEGLHGLNVLVLPKRVVAAIADFMMGGNGEVEENVELNEIMLSAVSEAMNQMMGSAATALSDLFGTSVNISPPNVKVYNFDDPNTKFPPVEDDPNKMVVRVEFDMEIEGLPKTKFFQILGSELVKQMYDMFTKAKGIEEQPQQAPASAQSQAPAQPQPQPTAQIPAAAIPGFTPPPSQISQPVTAQPVQFQELSAPAATTSQVPPDKLELLFDIPLRVTVELGRTKMTLKEVLELSVGSLIELDKLTGEPVDILVNGKLIARGEVVVIDENFGVRITDIISPKERLYAFRE